MAAIFMVAVFFIVFIFLLKFQHSTPNDFENNDFKNIDTDEQASSFGLPMRLKIPVINVDSAIEFVGTAPDGNMDTPKNPADVAWYKLGSRPGENGSAVITGHYGTWKNGQRSVFDNLHKLNQGDKVYIEDDSGKIISFVTRESRRYDPSADAKEVFNSNDEKAHLNLITCEGFWNKNSKSYSQRLVVFTDKEGD